MARRRNALVGRYTGASSALGAAYFDGWNPKRRRKGVKRKTKHHGISKRRRAARKAAITRFVKRHRVSRAKARAVLAGRRSHRRGNPTGKPFSGRVYRPVYHRRPGAIARVREAFSHRRKHR